MIYKLVQRKNVVLTAFAISLLVLLALTLIFGNGNHKIIITVLSLIGPVFVYGFFRLTCKIVRINASLKYMKVFVRFFLVTTLLGTVIMLFTFISEFPNGLSPELPMCMGVVIAAIDEEKKNMEIPK